MYGRMTTGSWIYIEPGILQGISGLTFAAVADKSLRRRPPRTS